MQIVIRQPHQLLRILCCLVLVSLTVLHVYPAAAAGNQKLPLASNISYEVTQGNNTQDSHQGAAAWAFDFGLGVGTPIYASRAGYVRMIKVDSNTGGCSSSYNPYTNYIIIDHQDDTAGAYWHLQYLGSVVSVGQFVQQGQHLGYSGETGYACGPHLHFQVQVYVLGQWSTQSKPTIFADHNHATDNGVPPDPSTMGGQRRVVKARNYGLEAAKTWYFAEGHTNPGFDEYLTIQNPTGATANITITYYVKDLPPLPEANYTVTKNISVSPNSRYTVAVYGTAEGVGRGKDVSARLVSNQPIIVERPTYFNYGGWADGGHMVMGYAP